MFSLKNRIGFSKFFLPLLLLAQTGLSGCAAPKLDPSTPEGMGAILDAVHIALNSGNCAKAVSNIEGVYNSPYSNNHVRLARAAAHGCYAKVEFFTIVLELTQNAPLGSAFWRSMSEMFYDATQLTLDKQITSAGYGMDALMALLSPGIVVANSYQINTNEYNPASMLVADRTEDSAVGLMLMTMASIGALQDRYSAPDTTAWTKTQVVGYSAATPTGWESATNTQGEGCQYASSILNMIDTVDQVGSSRTDALGRTLTQMASDFGSALALACLGGCRGNAQVIAGQAINFASTGCAIADDICQGDGTRACLASLRNRSACTGVVTDRPSCAAAGIAKFVNDHLTLGWN